MSRVAAGLCLNMFDMFHRAIELIRVHPQQAILIIQKWKIMAVSYCKQVS
jgi:hypothetical protein